MIDSPAASRTPPEMTPLRIVARVVVSIVGGWSFVWGCISLGLALLLSAGMDFGDARNLTHLLAFLVFLVVFFWAFLAARLAPVAIALFGGGGAMTAIAWLMLRTS